MSVLVVVIDTCALFPATLRDTLLRSAEAGLFRLRWSEEILDELGRNLQIDRDLTSEQTNHLLAEMRGSFPDATVTGYERLIGSMTNHPNDRHVLATAVQAAAHVIVTSNLRDFPEAALSPYNVEAQTPDDFLVYLFDLFPDAMADLVIQQNAARQRPPERLRDTLARLAKSAPNFVELVRTHAWLASTLEEERRRHHEHRGPL